MNTLKGRIKKALCLATSLMFSAVGPTLVIQQVQASDHADTPLLSSIGRNDVKLTDLYAFTRGEHLVLVLGIDPAIPPEATHYVFPTDVSYHINIDNNSMVRFNNEDDLNTYGGSLVHPRKIREDIVFEITFDEHNVPQLMIKGMKRRMARMIMMDSQLFTGLRDDPFIVKPRTGRNVAAIVLEVPMHHIINHRHGDHMTHAGRNTVLLWGTSSTDSVNSRFVELVGRSFRSTFPENDVINTLHPRLHKSQLGVTPDVMIYNLSKPAAYPNGRELTDDVATIIADPRIVAIDDPSPTENDVPFLDVFPYLAAPQ